MFWKKQSSSPFQHHNSYPSIGWIWVYVVPTCVSFFRLSLELLDLRDGNDVERCRTINQYMYHLTFDGTMETDSPISFFLAWRVDNGFLSSFSPSSSQQQT